jgi:hypothetical protein
MPSIDEPDPAGGTPVSADDDRSYNAVVTSPPQGADPAEVWVTIPALGQYRHGPCRFQPVPGVTPASGQRCLVVKGDGAAEWWIVQFDQEDVTSPDLATQAELDAQVAALDGRLDTLEGFLRVKGGSISVVGGASQVVTHGLGGTPATVQVTTFFNGGTPAIEWVVQNVGATQFTVVNNSGTTSSAFWLAGI